jgi:hypothetical protein
MSRKEKDKLALRRQRHRETVAKLLGDAQIEIDRRRELERDRVKAFVAEVPFIRSETTRTYRAPLEGTSFQSSCGTSPSKLLETNGPIENDHEPHTQIEAFRHSSLMRHLW